MCDAVSFVQRHAGMRGDQGPIRQNRYIVHADDACYSLLVVRRKRRVDVGSARFFEEATKFHVKDDGRLNNGKRHVWWGSQPAESSSGKQSFRTATTSSSELFFVKGKTG
jgi:hypothetical protein